jgi:hypothetical protein
MVEMLLLTMQFRRLRIVVLCLTLLHHQRVSCRPVNDDLIDLSLPTNYSSKLLDLKKIDDAQHRHLLRTDNDSNINRSITISVPSAIEPVPSQIHTISRVARAGPVLADPKANAVQASEDHAKVVIRQSHATLLHHDWFEKLDAVVVGGTAHQPSLSYYRIIPYAFTAVVESSRLGLNIPPNVLISIATWCTADRIHEIVPMVSRWRSRLSVAVLAVHSVVLTHHTIARLRACSVDVMRYVDFHIVLADTYTEVKAGKPTSHKSYMKMVYEGSPIDAVSCDDILAKGVGSVVVLNQRAPGDVPVMTLRNVARKHLRTPHVLMLDLGLCSSDGCC